MKNVGDLMKRLQKMMPANVKPAFTTGEELLAWQKEQGEIRAAALARENRAMKMQRTFNRSGIRPLHQNCSFDNYKVETNGQMNALAAAREGQYGLIIYPGQNHGRHQRLLRSRSPPAGRYL